ncbi:restriction endonuclease subunit S [Armatimonas rosea]|uniref:Type I restriction enzyme S subunit n=1 Tax=Armatimonas rosea TaxID=685828 RepID=A0A7W9W9K1_ARMRO|nr:restriction endonuclease subunit S [Armatimonas rosea]MBB6053928.1 type I restriction enzyme S subunit [Armatimonas rosea]
MSNKTTIGDYVTLQRGTTYKGMLVGKPGPALLGLGSIQPGGGFRESDYKTYGGDCPPKLMLTPGDLFVSLKGATKDGEMIGSVARVPVTVPSGRLTQDTVKLEFSDADKETVSYIYWILRTPQYRSYCAGHATGSAVVALSRGDFLSYPVPPLTEANRQIVELLEAIEGKVTLNRQMNETLEEMARTLFRSWFVDFDPVHAKAESRQPEGMDAEMAALFPSEFVESELGMIPKGWEVRSLDKIAEFLNGLALQKYPPREDTTDLPVIKIAQLRKGDSEGSDKANCDVPSAYVVQDGDVLFSWSGSLEVAVWCGGQGALNQHLFKVTSAEFPKWFYLSWVQYHLPEFQSIAASKATTMGHIQRHHLADAKVIVPESAVVKAADGMIAPIIDQIIQNNLEAKQLHELRDGLLPKLISGEIRLPEDMIAEFASGAESA